MSTNYCTICGGSGEGMHETETCSYCKGTGTELSIKEKELVQRDKDYYQAMLEDYNELQQDR